MGAIEHHGVLDENPLRHVALKDVAGAGVEFDARHAALYQSRMDAGLPTTVQLVGIPYRANTAAEKDAFLGVTGSTPDYSNIPGAGAAQNGPDTGDWTCVEKPGTTGATNITRDPWTFSFGPGVILDGLYENLILEIGTAGTITRVAAVAKAGTADITVRIGDGTGGGVDVGNMPLSVGTTKTDVTATSSNLYAATSSIEVEISNASADFEGLSVVIEREAVSSDIGVPDPWIFSSSYSTVIPNSTSTVVLEAGSDGIVDEIAMVCSIGSADVAIEIDDGSGNFTAISGSPFAVTTTKSSQAITADNSYIAASHVRRIISNASADFTGLSGVIHRQ